MITGAGSYGLDYYLGGKGKPTHEDAFHGYHSARLSYEEKFRYIRVDLEKPLTFNELSELTAWIKPLTVDGKLGIDLYLDGDGDGIWRSKSSRDVKLYARINSWEDEGLSKDQWHLLDAFDYDYKKSGDSGAGEMSLEDWQAELPLGLDLVRLYFRIYKPGNGNCLIDYINVGDMVLSFEPFESPEMKAGTPSKISRGSKITYTITYGNDLNVTLNDLVIVEHYDPRTALISADPPPDPGTNNVWTVGTLQPGEYGQITIIVRMMKQNFELDAKGVVKGEGYVSVRRRFSTERSPLVITNKVVISCDRFCKSAVVKTPVRAIPEASVTFNEHGSGEYVSSEELTYRSYKMIMKRDLNASQSNSLIALLHGRPLMYNSSWCAHHVCDNQKRQTLIGESYLHAEELDCANFAEVRSTRMKMDSEANFSGLGIYEIGSNTKSRDARLVDILCGNFSIRSGREIYK